MIKIAGLGRFAAATIVLSGIALGSASAQEVTEDQIKAARAAINATRHHEPVRQHPAEISPNS